MKTYWRVIKYGGPYYRLLPLFLLFTIIAVVFQTLNFTFLAPLLKIIFSDSGEIGHESWDTLPDFRLSLSYVKSLGSWAKNFLISGDSKSEALKTVCIVIVISAFCANLFTFLSKFIATFVKARLVRKLRVTAYNKITQMHIGYFSNERRGDIMSRLTGDIYEVETTIVPSLHGLISAPITVIFVFFILFTMYFQLTLFTLIILPVSALIISQLTRRLRKKARKGQGLLGDILGMVDETLAGIKIVKSFNQEDRIRRKFRLLNIKYQRTLWSIEYKKALASPISQFLGISLVAVILYYGGVMILNDDSLKPENFLVFIILFAAIVSPIKSISNNLSAMQRGLIASGRIFEILDSKEEVLEAPDPVRKDQFNDRIELKNIYFSYEDDEVIHGINLTIKKGESVALVGPSGGGKSTLADLICRFYDVDAGSIEIDGVDVRKIAYADLTHLLGIVTQESILFNDTIYNNILFGNSSATREDIEQAAKIANAHNFISEMEHGYDTEIGDKGVKLSGGQRQRLSIARAVLKNPPILVLDEATSALDTESEKLVQEAINNLMKNRTSIVIAHRLSTIQNSDKIAVIENGRVMEEGTHEELIAKKGSYYKLKEMQS